MIATEGQSPMRMHHPPHPGEILRELYLTPLNVTAAANALGVSGEALSELLDGHTDISPDMAIRLSKGFPNTDIRMWLDLQVQCDAWRAEQRAGEIEVRPLTPA
jgi:addiction module HigA family antidote